MPGPVPPLMRGQDLTRATHRHGLGSSARRAPGERKRRLTPGLLAVLAAILTCAQAADAQVLDCNRLQAQIAHLDRGGGRGAGQARRAGAELARTQAYAHQLGCDGFSFFGGNPECGGLNQRISQLQASVGQSQAAGGGRRDDLIARYNAACRQQPPQPRGFFESLFGGAEPQRPAALPPPTQPTRPAAGVSEADGDGHARGGSQAVCVRTCDGGFFPLAQSARRSGDALTEMCSALCPGTEAAVYTRNPNAEIKTAVSLDGHPYMDLPNAMKFAKSVTPTCSCQPAGKTWAEALANAEEVLGNARRGDIVVTQEKSDELAHQKSEAKASATPSTPLGAGTTSSLDAASALVPQPGPSTTPDAVRRPVRQVGPQP